MKFLDKLNDVFWNLGSSIAKNTGQQIGEGSTLSTIFFIFLFISLTLFFISNVSMDSIPMTKSKSDRAELTLFLAQNSFILSLVVFFIMIFS